MKKQIFLIYLLISLIQNAYSQMYKKHDWEESPIFYALTEEDKFLSSFAIKEKTLVQYQTPVVGAHLYETKHSIIRVNTDKGIDRHNRVYISMHGIIRIADIKARVIKKDGSIKVFDKSKIKELKNVKGYNNFKIFAIEGVEKNSQVEYLYTLEKNLTSIGAIVVQKDYLVKESEVIIKKPGNISLNFKSYNGFPKLEESKVKNRYAYKGIAKNIPAMIDEKVSAFRANRMKIAYIFGRLGGNNELWSGLENGVRFRFMSAKLKRYKSFLKQFDKEVQINEGDDEIKKINRVCKYIHDNFNKVDKRGQQYEELSTILKNKQASEFGIPKVYTLLFDHLQIDYEIVLSSDRFTHKFDSDFYSSYNLSELLIYFPLLKRYVAPGQFRSFLFYAPVEQIGNEGIFISKIGSWYHRIKVPNSDISITDRNFQIKVNTQAENVEINCEQKLTGYKAENARGAYRYFLKNDIKEYQKYTALSGIEDAEMNSFEVKDNEFIKITENIPFANTWNYTSEELFSTINEDLLISIGKVIGSQLEFYQEETRINDIELRYPNKYIYNFDIEIPENYEFVNIEDFNFSKELTLIDKEICLFRCKTTIDETNKKINIKINEDYNSLIINVKYYDKYKDVINAAYDFSQKNILLKKINKE